MFDKLNCRDVKREKELSCEYHFSMSCLWQLSILDFGRFFSAPSSTRGDSYEFKFPFFIPRENLRNLIQYCHILRIILCLTSFFNSTCNSVTLMPHKRAFYSSLH